MTSTFAVQPIPPFNPSKRSIDSATSQRSSQALPPFSSLAHIPSTSSAIVNSNIQQQSRRFSSTGVANHPYPSVFEIPNPHKQSDSNSVGRNNEERSLSRVQEEDTMSDSTINGKKRRAIDELDEKTRGMNESNPRRESQESAERRSSNESNGIRASFSFPANPHPPSNSSRSHSHSSRPSATSIPSPPPRNSPSPRSTRDPRHLDPSERYSPTSSSSKRARTSLGPLESLAATASDILSSGSTSPSPVSATSTSASTPPTTATHSTIASLIGPPSDSQTREHHTAFESSRQLREQQQKEIERRRIASGGTSSNQPPVGSVQAALGKLKSSNIGDAQRLKNSERDGMLVEGEESNGGLAKRRGHRPPAVTTTSFPPSNSTVAITSARSYEEAMRSAPPGIPSVLVGSPVEATWAARIGKEAGVGSARREGHNSHSHSNGASRRQSMSTAGPGGHPSFPSSIPSRDQAHSRSSISIPSSHPRGHSHQPPSSHLMSTSQSRDRQPQQNLTAHSHSHSGQQIPSPSTPNSHPHSSHPLSQSHSYDRNQQQQQHGGGTRLPPLNLIHLRNNNGNPSSAPPPPLPPHSHSSSHYPHSHSHSQPTSAANPTTPPSSTQSSSSSSKTAFLSLFSTFFDSLQDSKVLTTTLDSQIQRAGSLLTTLQQSELVLEQLVDRKIDFIEQGWRREQEEREKSLVGRLERLENIVFDSNNNSMQSRGGGVGLGITEQPSSSTFMLEERLEKLEKMLLLSNQKRHSKSVMEEEEVAEEDEEGDSRGSLPTPHEDKRDRGCITTGTNSSSSSRISRGVVGGIDERES
ncbi:hypothetical protein JCM3765_003413 [Sporobolomyces pararoseus]